MNAAVVVIEGKEQVVVHVRRDGRQHVTIPRFRHVPQGDIGGVGHGVLAHQPVLTIDHRGEEIREVLVQGPRLRLVDQTGSVGDHAVCELVGDDIQRARERGEQIPAAVTEIEAAGRRTPEGVVQVLAVVHDSGDVHTVIVERLAPEYGPKIRLGRVQTVKKRYRRRVECGDALSRDKGVLLCVADHDDAPGVFDVGGIGGGVVVRTRGVDRVERIVNLPQVDAALDSEEIRRGP